MSIVNVPYTEDILQLTDQLFRFPKGWIISVVVES